MPEPESGGESLEALSEGHKITSPFIQVSSRRALIAKNFHHWVPEEIKGLAR